jgi:hypothetical protein
MPGIGGALGNSLPSAREKSPSSEAAAEGVPAAVSARKLGEPNYQQGKSDKKRYLISNSCFGTGRKKLSRKAKRELSK